MWNEMLNGLSRQGNTNWISKTYVFQDLEKLKHTYRGKIIKLEVKYKNYGFLNVLLFFNMYLFVKYLN